MDTSWKANRRSGKERPSPVNLPRNALKTASRTHRAAQHLRLFHQTNHICPPSDICPNTSAAAATVLPQSARTSSSPSGTVQRTNERAKRNETKSHPASRKLTGSLTNQITRRSHRQARRSGKQLLHGTHIRTYHDSGSPCNNCTNCIATGVCVHAKSPLASAKTANEYECNNSPLTAECA